MEPAPFVAAPIAVGELLIGLVSLCWPALGWVNVAALALACGFTAVAALGYARRRVVRMVVAHDLAPEPVGNNPRACPAIARRVIAARSWPLITSRPLVVQTVSPEAAAIAFSSGRWRR